MIRGKRTFVCDNCHHKFTALDIEYMATSQSAPQQCPNCGSMHTMPYYSLGSNLVNSERMAKAIDKTGLEAVRTVYKSIWKLTEQRAKNKK